ncbi:DUF1002 domain-containing protein [Christensenellaceae bacterium OttesenSCG-928-K19]|nr:DUF1002 domain-containing protein [Christensenellaceae bacterium OttesenSCG-928-K19]
MKKKFISILLAVCCVMAFAATPALAASGDSRVTIGVDNTEEQIGTVYEFFRINRGEVTELQVTNAEERKYLEGIAPEQKIGNVALSCAYIEVRDSGGIELETFNINWCTNEMYKNALATAGITDAKVIVAAYKPVSGTGALTGIYKAYEDITGELLDETTKSVATEELVITSDLQEVLGDASPEFMNELKAKLAQTKGMTDDEIRQLIRDTAAEYDATLTEEQIGQILSLIKQMNELDIDPDTFLKLAEAGQGVQGFFKNVGDFFKGVGDFFSNLFGGFGGND